MRRLELHRQRDALRHRGFATFSVPQTVLLNTSAGGVAAVCIRPWRIGSVPMAQEAESYCTHSLIVFCCGTQGPPHWRSFFLWDHAMVRLSVHDAVDGSPLARECHECGSAKAPTIWRSQICTRLLNRSRHRQVSIPGSRRRCCWPSGYPPSVEAPLCFGVFQRLPPSLVGIEACASSHHRSRELKALGHTVRLMPPAYVKPYVKWQKNDATDAQAICEAVTRANMRFVPTKTPEQQSCLMFHRTRHLFIRRQTAVINTIGAHLAELGSSRRLAAKASRSCSKLLPIRATNGCLRLPARALPHSALSCVSSRSRFWSSIG